MKLRSNRAWKPLNLPRLPNGRHQGHATKSRTSAVREVVGPPACLLGVRLSMPAGLRAFPQLPAARSTLGYMFELPEYVGFSTLSDRDRSSNSRR